MPDRSRPGTGGLVSLSLALAAGLLGCSLDYGQALSEELAADVPDMVVYDFSHTIVQDGRPLFRLRADRAESYRNMKKTALAGVSFTEYSSDGAGRVVAEGRADSAVFWEETESAELYGAVRFSSARDGVRIETGNLVWDGQTRMLSSGTDTITTLSDDDGSRLSGSGFTADAARRRFSFTRRVDGSFRTGAGSSAAPGGNLE